METQTQKEVILRHLKICQIFGNNTRKTMEKELFIQLMEQQKQMSDLKKVLDRLDYRQREILKTGNFSRETSF